MFDRDKWQEIIDTIFRHPLRTALTAFGVSWGIFMLVLLMGAGKGLQNGVEHEFRDDATNSIWVRSGRTSIAYKGMPVGKYVRFSNEDYENLLNMEGTEHITARLYIRGDYMVRYEGESINYDVRAVHPGHRYLENTLVYQGRYINEKDIQERRKVAVIGKLVYEELMQEQTDNPIGEYIEIANVQYQVVGLYTDTGSDSEMQKIYLPVTTAQLTYGRNRELDQLMFTVGNATPEESARIETEARLLIAERMRVSPEDDRAIQSSNTLKRFQKFQNLFLGIRTFVWFVSIGTILAGIIGVSNIMLIIVKERTKEIGIRKALGATPASIISLVVQEAIFITAVAGFGGLAFGLLVLFGLEQALGGESAGYFRNP
ncbi:MAG: ABC transporter permease, partial [Bacteroidota bacterium]